MALVEGVVSPSAGRGPASPWRALLLGRGTWELLRKRPRGVCPQRSPTARGPASGLCQQTGQGRDGQARPAAGCDAPSPRVLSSQVTLMLLDQNHREHVIDAFRPDVTSSSFQRPVSDMNIASGCPLFCPVSKMEAKNSYVRDDAIFIKAIVDLTGL